MNKKIRLFLYGNFWFGLLVIFGLSYARLFYSDTEAIQNFVADAPFPLPTEISWIGFGVVGASLLLSGALIYFGKKRRLEHNA